MQYRGSSRDEKKGSVIDLFTDTVAILNLLDVRSIMGCPGGALAQYLLALLGQKRTSLYISREKTIIISSKHGATIFFPITIFFYENLKKNWPEKRA